MKKSLLFLLLALVFISGCVGQDGALNDTTNESDTTASIQIATTTSTIESATTTTIPESGIPSCGDETELFSVSPVDESLITHIRPLGNLAPSGHTFPTVHLYLVMDPDTGEVEVRAPSDIWITSVSVSEIPEQGKSDYTVRWKACEEFRGYFYHMSTVSESLQEATEGEASYCNEYISGGDLFRLCDYDVEIQVSAGEVIGTAGAHHDQLDFGARDMRTEPLNYANPDRKYDEQLHVVCALDYFTPDLKSVLKAKLGDNEMKRTVEPVCGEVEQDEPGTAQGIWYVEGTDKNYHEDEQLALVHDNMDPTVPVFSVGTSMENSGLQTGLYYFDISDSGNVNRDFDEVTPSALYCYEVRKSFDNDVSSLIILQLTDATTLKMERKDGTSCGTGPWSFGTTFTIFER